jgi:RNA recognition motif-containing protein
MVKLFIGGLPTAITEMEIVQMVGPYATVSTIKIVRDKISKKSKGYAFLEVSDSYGAEAAIEALDGTSIGDRMLTLNIVTEEQASRKAAPTTPKSFSRNAEPKKKRPRRNP